ncbi:TPA: hypothetical protein ACGRDC_001058 [Streptococcus agalactiae]
MSAIGLAGFKKRKEN